MKIILLFISISFVFHDSYAQEISREDLFPIFSKLGSEQWDSAFSLANKVIEAHPDDSLSAPRGLLNYICILSGAGRVSLGSMKHDELEVFTRKLIGSPVLMPAHPTTTDTSPRIRFNTNQLKIENDTVKGSCQSSNKEGTSILCFEYYTFGEGVDIKEFDGKSVRFAGTIESIELNPNTSTIWILRLRVKDAWLMDYQPPK